MFFNFELTKNKKIKIDTIIASFNTTLLIIIEKKKKKEASDYNGREHGRFLLDI